MTLELDIMNGNTYTHFCAFFNVISNFRSPPWPNLRVCAVGAPIVTMSYTFPTAKEGHIVTDTTYSQLHTVTVLTYNNSDTEEILLCLLIRFNF